VFSTLPKLLERSGRTNRGSITGFYSGLVDGDDAGLVYDDSATLDHDQRIGRTEVNTDVIHPCAFLSMTVPSFFTPSGPMMIGSSI
jgi:hypothetical protein